jgi:hypothetical protein
MRLRLKASISHDIRYDFIGGPNDEWVFDVIDKDLAGGYYTPAQLSGHPDSWAPEEGEAPSVDATIWLWVFPDNGVEPPTSAAPHFVIEVVEDRVVENSNLPFGVVDFVEETIVPKLANP